MVEQSGFGSAVSQADMRPPCHDLREALSKELGALSGESAERLVVILQGLFSCMSDLNNRVSGLEAANTEPALDKVGKEDKSVKVGRGKPRERVGIMLDPVIMRKSKKRAAARGESFSRLIERLLEREAKTVEE
jgi:hypothetical protein